MAGTLPATDYLEMKLLQHIFGTTAYTRPANTIHLGLFTAAPSDTGGGTEVTGGSYARVLLTQADATWTGLPTVGAGTISNFADLTFPTATANWGLCTYIGIFDAFTTGNLLFYGLISGGGKTVNSGDIIKFLAGNLSITLD
jgi:hypothetical protein